MNMTLIELRDALRERLSVVADHELRDRDPQAHLERLKMAAGRFDAVIARLPAECDPELQHYLARQSYTKALAWLETLHEESAERR